MLIKDKYREMREALDNMVARHIAEGLVSCCFMDDAIITKEKMDQWRFDVLGIKNDDEQVVGYVRGTQLKEGKCKEYCINFEPGSLISDSTSLFDVLILMENRERLFVLTRNEVSRIITRGDLQKAPMRLMIFSVLSILEMHLQREIEKSYEYDQSWEKFVSLRHLKETQRIYKNRQKSDEDVNIFECLYFSDKCEIVKNTPLIIDKISEQVSEAIEKLYRMNQLRNSIVHPMNIARGSDWCDIIGLVKDADILCQFFDNIQTNVQLSEDNKD